MLVLMSNEVCKFSGKCPYNGQGFSYCQGTNPKRESTFTCSFVREDGSFIDHGYIRNPNDVTGKMQFIIEGDTNE